MQKGLHAEALRYVSIIVENTLLLEIDDAEPAQGEGPLIVQVPTPAAYIFQKGLAFPDRLRRDRQKASKDLYYIFDILAGIPDEVTMIGRGFGELSGKHPAWFKQFGKILSPQFESPEAEGPLRIVEQRPADAFPGLDDDQLRNFAHGTMERFIRHIETLETQYLWAEHREANGDTPDYNAACVAKISGAGNDLLSLAVDSAADHKSVDSAFLVRTYADFVMKVHKDLHAGVDTAENDFNGWDNAAVEGLAMLSDVTVGAWAIDDKHNRLKATRTKLRNNDLKTKKKYAKPFLDNKLMLLIKAMMKDSLKLISGKKNGAATAGAREGITIIHFNYTNTYLRDLITAGEGVGSKLGSAVDVNDADRNKCVFLFLKSALDTFVHEIGHHLFLPHAPWKQNDQPMPGQPNRHDDTDKKCMMSYNRPRNAFCGLCQLRLRGWSALKLDKTSATNKKP